MSSRRTYSHPFKVFVTFVLACSSHCRGCRESNELGQTREQGYFLVVCGLLRNLLRAAHREGHVVIPTGLAILVPVLLDSIVELRDIIQMLFTDIPRTLKIGTIDLASFCHTLSGQCFEFVRK